MASPSVGGYNHEFLDLPAKLKKFECPVCQLVTREPNLTSCCGQHFCQSCINQVLTDGKPCPLCKEEGFTVFLDKKQRRKVLDLKVRCSLKDHGCDWTGGLGQLATHMDTQNGSCLFVDLTCPNSCGESCQRRHMSHHLTSECQNRPFSCKYCQFKATYQLVHQHYSKCEKFPLSCPNKCEIRSVERAKMTQHLSKCPLQLVECEYAYAGCSEKIRRKDLAMHMEQKVQQHLLWVSTTSQKRIQALEQQIEERVKALQREKERQLQTMKREVEEIRKELREKSEQLKSKVSGFETQLSTITKQPLRFIVQNYSHLRGRRVQKNSLFYLWLRGPRMYMSVNFSREVQIELHQLPGEFDEEINWPLFCRIVVFVINHVPRGSHYILNDNDHELYQPTRQTRLEKFQVRYAKLEVHSENVQYLVDDYLEFGVNVLISSQWRAFNLE